MPQDEHEPPGDAEPDAPAGGGGKPSAPTLRKRALLEAVAAASGQKLPAVRAVAEALLQELGAALARGDTVALPPLGRLTVARSKAAKPGEGATLVLRLKRPKPGGADAAPPGEPAQD